MKKFKNLLLLVLFLGCTYLSFLYYQEKTKSQLTRNSKIDQIIDLVEKKYVDPIDEKELEKQTLKKLFEELDPHSKYLDAQEAKARNQDLSGNFVGVGIRYLVIDDQLVISGLIQNGPAAQTSLQIGDRISAINDKPLQKEDLEEKNLSQLLKGPEGSIVKLDIYRPSVHQHLLIPIQRGAVPMPTVDAFYFLKKDLGYIRLNMFGENTADEVLTLLDQMKEKGAEKIILDLRDNGGGYLSAVLDILEELLPAHQLVLYTEGKNYPRENYYTTRNGFFEDLPLIVLINQNTASASEILSGTLQDYDRALIVGRRSFGKGLVQEPFDIFDQSEVVLTIAKYHTPSGRCVQKPYDMPIEKYHHELEERLATGELFNPKSMPHDPHQVFATVSGRRIYGGGGIIPDIFVPLKKDQRTVFLNQLFEKSLLNHFAFLYAEAKKFTLAHENFEKIMADPMISDQTIEDFLIFAQKSAVQIPEKISTQETNQIKYWLKAFVLMHVYQNNEFYFEQFLALEDEDIQAGIKHAGNYKQLLQAAL